MPFDATFQPLAGMQASLDAYQELANAKKKYEEQQTEGAYNDTIVNHAYQLGRIGLDDLNKYNTASGTAKRGIASGIAAGMMDDMKRQQQAVQQQEQMAQTANLMTETQQRQTAQTFRPNTYQVQGPDGHPRTVVQLQQGGQWQPISKLDETGGSSEPIQTDPVNDPQTKQPVPGLGYDRKTGALINFNALQSQGVNVQIDPQTGVPFYMDSKGNPKALTADQLYGGQQMKQKMEAEQNKGKSIFSPAVENFLRNGPFGAPSPTPAPVMAAPAAPIAPVQSTAPAQPSIAPVAPQPSARVRVKAPNGAVGNIPAEQLQQAIAAGYTQL